MFFFWGGGASAAKVPAAKRAQQNSVFKARRRPAHLLVVLEHSPRVWTVDVRFHRLQIGVDHLEDVVEHKVVIGPLPCGQTGGGGAQDGHGRGDGGGGGAGAGTQGYTHSYVSVPSGYTRILRCSVE